MKSIRWCHLLRSARTIFAHSIRLGVKEEVQTCLIALEVEAEDVNLDVIVMENVAGTGHLYLGTDISPSSPLLIVRQSSVDNILYLKP